MKDHYDPEYDSPEARANFATRHIFMPRQRRALRDKLIAQYRAEKVVQLFPKRERHWGEKTLSLDELKDGGITLITVCDSDFADHFARMKRRTAKCEWRFLLSGEWSQSQYHQGRHQFSYRHTGDRRYWAVISVGFPNRIVAVADTEIAATTEHITAVMLRRVREQGEDYIDMVWNNGEIDMDEFWETYWEKI